MTRPRLCKYGHDDWEDRGGYRRCRTCHRIRERERKRRERGSTNRYKEAKSK